MICHFIDNIKEFAKNDKELKTLIQTLRRYNQDIGMEFGIDKCAMLIMKSGKRESSEAIETPYKEYIRKFGKKENYK